MSCKFLAAYRHHTQPELFSAISLPNDLNHSLFLLQVLLSSQMYLQGDVHKTPVWEPIDFLCIHLDLIFLWGQTLFSSFQFCSNEAHSRTIFLPSIARKCYRINYEPKAHPDQPNEVVQLVLLPSVSRCETSEPWHQSFASIFVICHMVAVSCPIFSSK